MSSNGILREDYLTTPELAAELGRSTRTLDRWALTGDGPPRTLIGRKTLYRRDAVLAWLRSREQSLRSARRGARR
jgi:predicted DNA-binding transcriptional regulator AlpA